MRIGEFSSLSRVSVKTLRYYDEIGLLKPASVDAPSGYRHYSAAQLPRLHRILALKDLGLPLERIADMLTEAITPEMLRGMLMLRKAEQQCRVREESDRLLRIEGLLRLLEREGTLGEGVVLKQLPPQWVVSLRETLTRHREIGALFGRLYEILGGGMPHGTGIAIWHDQEHKEEDVDAEAGICLNGPIAAPETLTVYQIAGATVASLVHHGSFSRIAEAY